MRSAIAIAFTAAVALSAPAFAQSAGSPGAVGASGPMIGHNTEGSGVDSQQNYNSGYRNGNGNGYRNGGGYGNGEMSEGRASTYDSGGNMGPGPGYRGPDVPLNDPNGVGSGH